MANFISDIISYGCKFGTFSEIANQFTNIRFGDIVKVPVTSTVHFTKCNDLHSITNMRPVGGKYTKVCLFCVFLWFSTLNNQKRTYNAFRIIRQLIIIFVFCAKYYVEL